MDIFLKVTAAILLSAILSLVLSKQGADISLLLTIAVSCMILIAALTYIKPILDFSRKLVIIGGIRTELLEILFKVVGIGMISQIAGLICADAGNQSLGKALQIMTIAVILCLSIPVLEEMLSLIETVLTDL